MHDETLAGAAASRARASFGLVLGALSAIGPLAIDLYLPAFPAMTSDLATSPGEVQRTLSMFFLALAVAQIPIGVMSDRRGRKFAFYLGLGLFCVSSVACAFATSVRALQVLRFVQGFGVCAGTVVSRAMIRDLASGYTAARLMAVSFLIIGVSPVLAPLAGNALLTVLSWRGLFLVMAGIGLFGLALVRFVVPESLPPQRRKARGTPVLPELYALLRNRRFIAGSLIAGLSMTVPYAYVTAAPFVFTGGFGVDARHYTLLLAISAASSIGSMQLSPALMKRWGPRVLITRAGLGGFAMAALAIIIWSSGLLNVLVFQVVSMLLFAAAGLMLTPAAVSALDAASSGAGTAASMVGTGQLAVTAVASSAISLSPPFSVVPILSILAAGLALAVALGRSLAPATAPAQA